MSTDHRSFDRRDFLRQAGALGAALGSVGSAMAKSSSKGSSRVIGANDRINIGVIGVGGRGSGDARDFARIGAENNSCQVVAVADCYQRRINRAKEALKISDGYLDYREIIHRNDIDAVVIATPDHWHARIALEAMDHGKDVYLEKPMCHTIDEARQLVATVKETGRVLQVGSQTTSADQWWKAKKAIADGMIGKMIMSQGSYHRNSVDGEWNYKIDEAAGPDGKGEDFIDWKMWLGSAPKRPYDADRFFRFRKYWDYSGGHSVVLSSSMANSVHIPGLIRGHEGTITMVDHGRFEGVVENITMRPEYRTVREDGKPVKKPIGPDYKFGVDEQKIAVDQHDMMAAHIGNFLESMRTRKKPHLDVETAACAQVAISMAVESYRSGKVLYFDEKKWKVSDKPVKA